MTTVVAQKTETGVVFAAEMDIYTGGHVTVTEVQW